MKTYNIVSNNNYLICLNNRTVRQNKQIKDTIVDWQSRSGNTLDSNFVPDGSRITNIWSGYGNIQNDLNACVTNVFYANQATEWYRDEWNYRWGIPSRVITRVPVRLTQLTFQFNGRNSDNNGWDGYGVELFAGLGSYGTTKLVSDFDAWGSPHSAGQSKSYTINDIGWYDHFMMIVSCRGVSYHDRVGYKNVIFYGKKAIQEIIDISGQQKTVKEDINLLPTEM